MPVACFKLRHAVAICVHYMNAYHALVHILNVHVIYHFLQYTFEETGPAFNNIFERLFWNYCIR